MFYVLLESPPNADGKWNAVLYRYDSRGRLEVLDTVLRRNTRRHALRAMRKLDSRAIGATVTSEIY